MPKFWNKLIMANYQSQRRAYVNKALELDFFLIISCQNTQPNVVFSLIRCQFYTA